MDAAPIDLTGLPQQGDIIDGRYQVEELLGSGGMGVVVAARHLGLRQRVAVKLLFPGSATLEGATERFLREARLAASIQSEHVTRILDVGTLESGAPYMVMEYLSGTDLNLMIEARGPLPVQQAVDFILQVGEAIAEAHAIGIIHRDLKTHNLFLTIRPDGSPRLKVLDFGLSKASQPDFEDISVPTLTATDAVAGSPVYMSPEQLRGLRLADARSDIWALGVILYEMLTGHRPFGGTSLTALSASIAADDPAPVRSLRRSVPDALDALVMRCLEKDPGRRVQSVAEMARGLAPFASGRAAISVERICNMAPSPPMVRADEPGEPGAEEWRSPIPAPALPAHDPAPFAPARPLDPDTSSLFFSNPTSPRLATLLPTPPSSSAPPYPVSLPVLEPDPPLDEARAPVTRSAAVLVLGSAAASLLIALVGASTLRLMDRDDEAIRAPAAHVPAITMSTSPPAMAAPVSSAAPATPAAKATAKVAPSKVAPSKVAPSKVAPSGPATARQPASRPAASPATPHAAPARSAAPRRAAPPSQWPSSKPRAVAKPRASDPLERWD